MLNIQLIISDGEKILTQATHEIENSSQFKDFIEKTLPGLEQTAEQLLSQAAQAVVTEVENIEHQTGI